MSTENEVQEPVVEPVVEAAVEPQVVVPAESDKLEEDAAIQAGYNEVNGIVAPAEPEPEPPKLFAGYTEEQIREMASTVEALKGRETKIFGTMGSLKQAIDTVRAAQAAQPTPAAQAAVSLTADKLTRLSAEFPEIAKMLAEDLNGVLLAGGAAPDPAQFEAMVEKQVQTRMEKSDQATESRFLTFIHPDWKEVVKAQDFVDWKATLPSDEAAELDASWDATFIGSKLTAFKDWKAKAVQTKTANKQRLEAAITPKSGASPRPAPTENDAFLSGFKAVRG